MVSIYLDFCLSVFKHSFIHNFLSHLCECLFLIDMSILLCYIDHLQCLLLLLYVLNIFQLSLAKVSYNSCSQRVSQDIDCCAESVQQPVNGEDEGHSLARKTNSVQHHHHGDKTSLWNACSSNTGRCSRDRYRND